MKLFFSRCFVATLFLFALQPTSSYAWNALGHMVIANIAYQHLTPTAAKKVDQLVKQLEHEYPDMTAYMNVAYWPDSLRSQHIESFTHWHYIDHAFSTDSTPLKNLIDTDNAVWAMNTIQQVIKNEHANVYDRARFLSFITHIVGDLHQPLHTVSLISANHPNGDKGGNEYLIQHNRTFVNLHKLWDSGVGLFNGASSTQHATLLANQMTADYPMAYFGDQINIEKADTWSHEGMEMAKQFVYSTPENAVPSENYYLQGKQTAEKRATLAGYRLAALLNQLLG